MMNRISKEDLSHVLNHTKDLWLKHFPKGSKLFITGGTGFFGKWLLETFMYANDELSLDGKLLVLSRNPEKFLMEFPQFNIPTIEFVKGDVCSFSIPEKEIDFIIHAATEASVSLNLDQPFLMFDTIVEGTKRTLELAKEKKVKTFLYISSGAVYGKQPFEITHITEEYTGCPDIYDSGSAYGEGKRVAEMLCNLYFKNYNVSTKIARCFAFAGPYLPLDSHFAFGNFINNVIQSNTISINGDGTPFRSYMYPSDLCIWLWTILFTAPPCSPFNVGSDEEITIEQLANKIAALCEKEISVEISSQKTGNKPLRYVPSVKRANEELSLHQTIRLDETIRKTLLFNNSESI